MRIVMVGGSLSGLLAALFLVRSGYDVLVLEADDAAAPGVLPPDATWFRRGTPHSRQAHAFMSGFVRELRRHAPDLLERMLAAGAILRSFETLMPATITDRTPEASDHEIEVLNARRPLIEAIVRSAALEAPGITWSTGTHVAGLEATMRDGIPHVTGVRSDDGTFYAADVVIDASGRRSGVDRWLSGIGARPASFHQEACNQIYFGRYYLLDEPGDAPVPTGGFLSASPSSSCTAIAFPGDNGVVQLAATFLPEDEALKSIRDPSRFHAFVSFMPQTRPWIEGARPITGIAATGALQNHLRRLVVHGSPVVTGFHLVGDAWCITNPQFGRGVAHAAIGAAALARVLSEQPDDARAQALALDDEATRMLEPSFRDSVAVDRVRTSLWRGGMHDAPPAFASAEEERRADLSFRVLRAGMTDPVMWRTQFRCAMVLDPPGSWTSDEALLTRLPPEGGPLPPTPGPSRAEILDAIDAAG